MRIAAAKLALAPLLLWQGRRVRAQALRLPEAAGPREGRVGEGDTALRLLVVGDSSAAGVGADTQQQALAGQLAQALAPRLARAVDWHLLARSGQTAVDALAALEGQVLPAADVAVVALGVNDVTGQVPPARWLAALDRIDGLLRERSGVRYVLHCAVPPMQSFPLLPQPLRWWMGAQALRLNARLARHLAGQPLRGLQALPQAWQEPARAATLMAADGFHPNPAGYALWAEVLAEHLAATRVTGLSQTR